MLHLYRSVRRKYKNVSSNIITLTLASLDVNLANVIDTKLANIRLTIDCVVLQ